MTKTKRNLFPFLNARIVFHLMRSNYILFFCRQRHVNISTEHISKENEICRLILRELILEKNEMVKKREKKIIQKRTLII